MLALKFNDSGMLLIDAIEIHHCHFTSRFRSIIEIPDRFRKRTDLILRIRIVFIWPPIQLSAIM